MIEAVNAEHPCENEHEKDTAVSSAQADAVVVEPTEAVAPEHAEAVVIEQTEAVAPEHAEAVVVKHTEAVAPEHAEAVVVKHTEAVAPEHAEAVVVELSAPVEAVDPVASKSAEPIPEEKSSLLARGNKAFLAGRYDIAIDCLGRALEPGSDWDSWYCLGLAHVKRNNFDLAHIILTQVVDDCPEQSVAAKARQARSNLELEMKPAAAVAAPLFPCGPSKPASPPAPVVQEKKQTFKQPEKTTQEGSKKSGFLLGNPLVLLVAILGGLYYAAAMILPGWYTSTLFNNASGGSVTSLGDIDGVSGQALQIQAAHQSKLTGFFYEKRNAPFVLVIHPAGIKNDLPVRKSLAEAALHAGFSVLLYDTGTSDNMRTWDGFIDDAYFVRDHAHTLGYKDNAIVNYGCGLGAATASYLSKHAAGLILENSARSVPALIKAKYPWMQIFPDVLFPERQCVLQKVAAEHPPLLMLQSRNSEIPAAQTSFLSRSISDPKTVVVETANIQTPHWTSVTSFLNTLEPPPKLPSDSTETHE